MSGNTSILDNKLSTLPDDFDVSVGLAEQHSREKYYQDLQTEGLSDDELQAIASSDTNLDRRAAANKILVERTIS